MAAIIEAEARAAQGSPVYAYQLNYRSPVEGGRYGAMHTMDIPLVFDNIAQPRLAYRQRAPTHSKSRISMSEAFIAFARTVIRITRGCRNGVRTSCKDRSTMVFDAQSKSVNDPRGEERKLFSAVPYIQRGTY